MAPPEVPVRAIGNIDEAWDQQARCAGGGTDAPDETSKPNGRTAVFGTRVGFRRRSG